MSNKKENRNVKVVLIWDNVSDSLVTTVIGLNAKACVCNAMYSGIGNKFEYKDLDLIMVGEIDRDKPKMIAYNKPVKLSWDIYKASKTEREALEPLGEEVLKAYDEMKAKEEEEKKKNETANNTDNSTTNTNNDSRM